MDNPALVAALKSARHPASVGRELRRIAPNLRAAGVTVDFDRDRGRRTVRIGGDTAVTAVTAVTDRSTTGFAGDGRGDGNDNGDGIRDAGDGTGDGTNPLCDADDNGDGQIPADSLRVE